MRTWFLIAIAATPATSHANPIEELVLGETATLRKPAELQLGVAAAANRGGAATRIKGEVGVTEHLQLSGTLLPRWHDTTVTTRGEVALEVGARVGRIDTLLGVGTAWVGDDAAADRVWRGRIAIGAELSSLGVHASATIEDDRPAIAAAISLRIANLTPHVEVSLDRDDARIATGVLWSVGREAHVGVTAIAGSERPSLVVSIVGNLDFASGDFLIPDPDQNAIALASTAP